MKRVDLYPFIIALMLLISAPVLQAQIVHYGNSEPIQRAAEIDYRTGDTIAIVQLREVYCFNRKRFSSEKYEKAYWRMVNDVKKTLPIAQAARRMMVMAYDSVQYLPKKEQRKYFKELEKNLMKEYKPRLKKLNYRQGKLLVRLVDRECDKRSYELIKEFLGTGRAFFWNMFGKMFGVSLKARWEPDGKDKELEDICLQVEQGSI